MRIVHTLASCVAMKLSTRMAANLLAVIAASVALSPKVFAVPQEAATVEPATSETTTSETASPDSEKSALAADPETTATADPEQALTESPAAETDSESNESVAKLDEAIRLKLNVERLDDLETIIDLCEEALEDGLSKGHKTFAQQLLSSTLYERASHVIGPVLQGKADSSWIMRRKTALDDLERAMEVNSNDGEAFLLAAELHELPGGSAKEGKAAAEQAVKLLSDNPERYSQALTIRANFQQNVEKRLADYDAAIEADKSNAEAWRERGRTKLALGDAKTALEDFRHLLESDEDDVEAMQAMGEAMASLGQFDEALETLDALVKKTPDQSVGYSIRARVRMAKGDLEQAEEDLNSAIKINPRDLVALMMRTRLRLNLEKYDLALGDANRILDIQPGFPQAILLRSLVYSSNGDFGRAITDLRRLLRRDPKNTEIRLQLASIYSVDGQSKKSVQMFNEILKQNPKQLEALRGRADANLNIGAHAEAIADYEQVILIEPKDSGALNNLAWVLATSPVDAVRNGERAIEIGKRACDATDYKAAHIVSTLAAGYAETGDFAKAIEWSTKSVDLGQGAIKEQLREELESYKEGKPWRELQQPEQDDGSEDLESDLEGSTATTSQETTSQEAATPKSSNTSADDVPKATTPEVQTAEWAVKWWMPRHEQKLVDLKKQESVDLLMIGDSITHGFENTGKEVWEKYYRPRHAFNLGFSGDRTENVLWRLQHGAIKGMSPKLAVIMIGTNNTGHRQDPPEEIAAGIRAIVDELRSQLPETKLLLLAIFPRDATSDGELRQINDAANKLIAKFVDDEHIFFLDINDKFLTDDGVLEKDIMPDLLHPNGKGYTIWAEAMEPMVKKLME